MCMCVCEIMIKNDNESSIENESSRNIKIFNQDL